MTETQAALRQIIKALEGTTVLILVLVVPYKERLVERGCVEYNAASSFLRSQVCEPASMYFYGALDTYYFSAIPFL